MMKPLENETKIEQNGKSLYEKLAKGAGNADLRAIFLSLAQDEQKHFDVLRKLQEGTPVIMTDSQTIQKAKKLVNKLVSERANVSSAKWSLKWLQDARNLEADSIRCYTEAELTPGNEEAFGVIDKILADEHEHFKILDNLYYFALAPQNYLTWGEFRD